MKDLHFTCLQRQLAKATCKHLVMNINSLFYPPSIHWTSHLTDCLWLHYFWLQQGKASPRLTWNTINRQIQTYLSGRQMGIGCHRSYHPICHWSPNSVQHSSPYLWCPHYLESNWGKIHSCLSTPIWLGTSRSRLHCELMSWAEPWVGCSRLGSSHWPGLCVVTDSTFVHRAMRECWL